MFSVSEYFAYFFALISVITVSAEAAASPILVLRPKGFTNVYYSSMFTCHTRQDFHDDHCQILDFNAINDTLLIIDRIKAASKETDGSLCPVLSFNGFNGTLVTTVLKNLFIEHEQTKVSTVVITSHSGGCEIISAIAAKYPSLNIVGIDYSNFFDTLYFPSGVRDLTGYYFSLGHAPRDSVWLSMFAIATMTIFVALICIFSGLMVKQNYAHYALEKREVGGNRRAECILFILLPFMLAALLILLFYFYDYFSYVLIGHFVLLSAYLNTYSCHKVLALCHSTKSWFEHRFTCCKIKCHTHLVPIFLLFFAIAITWAVFIRIQPLSWSLHFILSFGLLFGISCQSVLKSFKSIFYLFLLITIYDVLMVYISPYWKLNPVSAAMKSDSGSSVMESVATGTAGTNGLRIPLAFSIMLNEWYPDVRNILGYGDVVIPNILSVSMAFYDKAWQRRGSYFWLACLGGHTTGLVLAWEASRMMKRGQPALLFICPTMLVCLLLTVLIGERVDGLKRLWRFELPSFQLPVDHDSSDFELEN